MHVLTNTGLSLFPDFLPRCGLSYGYLLFYGRKHKFTTVTTTTVHGWIYL